MSNETSLQAEMERAKAQFWRQPEAALQVAATAISAAVTSKSARDLGKKVGALREQAEALKAGAMTQADALGLAEDLKQAVLKSPIVELRAAYQDYLGMVARLLQTSLKTGAPPDQEQPGQAQPAVSATPGMPGVPTPPTKLGVAHVSVVGALAGQYAKGFEAALASIELPITVFTESEGRFGINTLEAVQLKAYWLRALNRYDAVASFLNGAYSVEDAATLSQTDAGSAVGASMAWTAFAHEHNFEKARRVAAGIEDRMRERAGRPDASLVSRLQLAEVLIAASSPHTPGDPAAVPADQRLAKLREAESVLGEAHRTVVEEHGRRSENARVFDDRLLLVRMLLEKPEATGADIKDHLDHSSPRDLAEPALRSEPFRG